MKPGRKPGCIDPALLARLDAERAERLYENRHSVVPRLTDDDDRTCLFCSRALIADQRICEHCGAYAP